MAKEVKLGMVAVLAQRESTCKKCGKPINSGEFRIDNTYQNGYFTKTDRYHASCYDLATNPQVAGELDRTMGQALNVLSTSYAKFIENYKLK